MTRFFIFCIILSFVCGIVTGDFMKKSWAGKVEAQEIVVQEEEIREVETLEVETLEVETLEVETLEVMVQEKETLDFEVIDAEITGYSPSPHITDSTPFEMSSGRVASPQELEQLKFVALSMDILEEYNIKFGDEIWISFEVQDKMGPKAEKSVDIFFRNLDLARKWGRQKRQVIIIRNFAP